MKRIAVENKSNKSGRGRPTKTTILGVMHDKYGLRVLEERLFKSCSRVIRAKRVAEAKDSVNGPERVHGQIDQIKDLVRSFRSSDPELWVKLMGPGAKFERALSELSALASQACPNAKVERRVFIGRPSVEPELALLLYAILERAMKKRTFLNRFGELIRPGGSLNYRVDDYFGPGSYESLHLPAPNLKVIRWERTCKASLKRHAEAYVFGTTAFQRVKKKSPEWAKKHFSKRVSEGGFSWAELGAHHHEE